MTENSAFADLPASAEEVFDWKWHQAEGYYAELASRPLDEEAAPAWLTDWTRVSSLIGEALEKLHVATTRDTADKDLERRYHAYLEEMLPPLEAAEQRLRQRLLESGFETESIRVPLRGLRADAELYREENVPLLVEEQKLDSEYARIAGAQTVTWKGEEKTIQQMQALFQETDRTVREAAWRLVAERQLEDRQVIGELWVRFLDLRLEISRNAGFQNYRDYRWKALHRFDYTPQDCQRFRDAIESEVVPAATALYEARRKKLGLDRLRPWDLSVDPLLRPPLRPYSGAKELESGVESVFKALDPALAEAFSRMRQTGSLDLESRKGKAPGGYCTFFPVEKKPFIFMNGVGLHDDVQTLLHESGHAFHFLETARWPWALQWNVGVEFAEVASMAMELLALPSLSAERGGFYRTEDAERALAEHLESVITLWPYIAVVDAFQHWVYDHPEQARVPESCDTEWESLWRRFMPGIDYSGFEETLRTGWQRKLHIHQIPFYYIEYGMAQLASVQVWKNSLEDPGGALASYRNALSLGGTASLPDLYAAAGARFRFDRPDLKEAVDLVMGTLREAGAV
ncbi:MAG: M3 family oligoendopeptidase [Synergistaceae bacterium]|jgi:oligoendopeptidase F|nr:M3 family oligoendopeptidase [Synergistaceae bacterium]